MQSSFQSAMAPLLKRAGQLIWYVDHWNDVEADMMVFFRIEDPENYPDAAKFFRWMYRLPAYRGTLREQAMREAEEASSPNSQQQSVKQNSKSKIKSTGAKKGYARLSDPGKQRAFIHNQDAEYSKVKPIKSSYLQEKLKQQQ